MASWPSSLPQEFDEDGFSESGQDPTMRTELDMGPVKARPRFTAVSTYYKGKLTLNSSSDVETLKSFWKDTCAMGSLTFTWNDPITRAVVDMRFRGRPTFSMENTYPIAQVSLEVLPS